MEKFKRNLKKKKTWVKISAALLALVASLGYVISPEIKVIVDLIIDLFFS